MTCKNFVTKNSFHYNQEGAAIKYSVIKFNNLLEGPESQASEQAITVKEPISLSGEEGYPQILMK